ncbi:MAG: hypothetical protein AAF830_16540 [Pseudomonadota bacterium]
MSLDRKNPFQDSAVHTILTERLRRRADELKHSDLQRAMLSDCAASICDETSLVRVRISIEAFDRLTRLAAKSDGTRGKLIVSLLARVGEQ